MTEQVDNSNLKNQITTEEDSFALDTCDSHELTVENNKVINIDKLNEESLAIISKLIEEPDIEKSKDLTYLFNVNQNKKTLVRVNKLNELMDAATDQAIARFTKRPDEISNKELIDILKVSQDLIERGQQQAGGTEEQPLIQINQQDNSINIDASKNDTLSRDSRERVKNAVLGLLNGLTLKEPETVEEAEICDLTPETTKDNNATNIDVSNNILTAEEEDINA